MLVYETSDNDNDEARVRLKSEIVAGHKKGYWIKTHGRRAPNKRRKKTHARYHWVL